MLKLLSNEMIALRNRVFRAGDYLFRAFVAGPPRADGPVLVLRPDGIGDFVIWCDAARWLREMYAPRQIVLVASHIYASLAESTGYFDQVIPIDTLAIRRSLSYHFKLLCVLRRVRPAIILNTVLHREQFHDTSESLVRALPARVVIGWALESSGRQKPGPDDALYTQLVRRVYSGKSVNTHNATFLQALGAKNFSAQLPRLPVLPAGDQAAAFPAQPYFVLCPSASTWMKRWPAAAFADIGRRLHAQTGWVGLVAGSKNDGALCAEVCLAGGGFLENCAGRFALPQFAELIRGARLVLSNDTGAAHIGAAYQTPTVCLLGGGHYGEFLPYKMADDADAPNPACVIHPMPCFGCDWQCLYPSPGSGPAPCIARISADEVWAAILRQLRLAGRNVAGQQDALLTPTPPPCAVALSKEIK